MGLIKCQNLKEMHSVQLFLSMMLLLLNEDEFNTDEYVYTDTTEKKNLVADDDTSDWMRNVA